MKKEKRSGQSSKKNNQQPDLKWLPVLFGAIAFIIYANTLNHSYAIDDGKYTFENKFVRNGLKSIPDLIMHGTQAGVSSGYAPEYRPVLLISFAIETSVFGNKPQVNHFFNVLFYALLCGLLFSFLRKLFKEYKIYLPVSIALLFIMHPIHTEVVANIKGRDEILLMLFEVLSLNYLVIYMSDEIKNKKYLIFSCISFFLCVFTKESGYSYLLIIPLILYFFTESSFKKIIFLMIPFIAIASAGLIVRSVILDEIFIGNKITVFDNSLVAAGTMSEMLASTFVIMLYALRILFVPLNLSWDYSYNQFPVVTLSNGMAILSLTIHLALLVYALLFISKKNIFSFAIIFYFCSYLITSNLVIRISSTFGERFLFLPSLAFCIAIPFLLSRIFKVNFKEIPFSRLTPAASVLSIILVLFAVRTVARNKEWANDFTIYKSGINTSPNSARTHFSYANELRKNLESTRDMTLRKNFAITAIDEYNKGLSIYQDTNTYSVYYNMGVIYSATGDTLNAANMYKRALEIKPRYSDALNNYAVLLFRKNDYSGALDYFIKAAESVPPNKDAMKNAGSCYYMTGDYKNAIGWYEKALLNDPSNSSIMKNLSLAYLNTGDTARAAYFQQEANKY